MKQKEIFGCVIFFMINYGLSTLLFASSAATSSDMHQLKYVKLGTEVGAGYRLHQNAHGCDFSLNYTSYFEETWTGGKALYLFYPFFHSKKYFYLGAGAGVVYGTLDGEQSIPPLLT